MKTLQLLSCVFVLSGLPAILSATTLATFDFQGETVDAAPAGTGVLVGNTSGANDVLVVDDASAKPDPFGGPGNKSVFVHRLSTDATLPIFQLQTSGFTGGVLASGTLSFDFYLETVTNGRGSVEINLGSMATASSLGRQNSFAAFQINASTASTTGGISYFNNTTSGGSITTSGFALIPNAKNTLSVSWDDIAKTYSIALNGSTVISSAYTVSSIAGLSSIRFTTVNGNTDINYYIDNVVVSNSAIPEPSTAAILVGGAGLMAAVGIRRSVR
jgi:hypothetical protein